jgi:hypothetical protein
MNFGALSRGFGTCCLQRRRRRVPFSLLDYQEFIGAKKHLVLSLRSQTGPLASDSFAIENIG